MTRILTQQFVLWLVRFNESTSWCRADRSSSCSCRKNVMLFSRKRTRRSAGLPPFVPFSSSLVVKSSVNIAAFGSRFSLSWSNGFSCVGRCTRLISGGHLTTVWYGRREEDARETAGSSGAGTGPLGGERLSIFHDWPPSIRRTVFQRHCYNRETNVHVLMWT